MSILDRSRQAEHVNMGCAMVYQQACTFIHGCAGGIDIINQQYLFPHDRFFTVEAKGIFYV